MEDLNQKNSDISQWVGKSATREFDLTDQMILQFANLSGDHSPIHIDPQYATSRGFKGRVVHGALQSALVSCILGMDLPGPRGLLQELSMKYRKPCFGGDRLSITVTVEEVFASVKTVCMKIKVLNQHGETIAIGKAQSGVAQDE